MTFKQLLRRAPKLLFLLTGEGGWRLLPHERAVIDAAVQSLPKQVQQLVTAQLAQEIFFQRIPRNITELFFDQRDPSLRIVDPAFEDRLLKVKICVDGHAETAHVTFSRGYIDSVQFKKAPKFYAQGKYAVCGVSEGEPGRSHRRALHRLEHGTSKEDEL